VARTQGWSFRHFGVSVVSRLRHDHPMPPTVVPTAPVTKWPGPGRTSGTVASENGEPCPTGAPDVDERRLGLADSTVSRLHPQAGNATVHGVRYEDDLALGA